MLTMIIHPSSHFLERVEDYELDLESFELVGGQIMRKSESEG